MVITDMEESVRDTDFQELVDFSHDQTWPQLIWHQYLHIAFIYSKVRFLIMYLLSCYSEKLHISQMSLWAKTTLCATDFQVFRTVGMSMTKGTWGASPAAEVAAAKEYFWERRQRSALPCPLPTAPLQLSKGISQN